MTPSLSLISLFKHLSQQFSSLRNKSKLLCEGFMQKSGYATEIITVSACLTSGAENVADLESLCMSVRAPFGCEPESRAASQP